MFISIIKRDYIFILIIIMLIVGVFVSNNLIDDYIVDYTKGKLKYCNIHSQVMKTNLVDIEHGLLMLSDCFEMKLSEKYFPNAHQNIAGGYEFIDNKRWAWIFDCPQCDLEKEKWIQKIKFE